MSELKISNLLSPFQSALHPQIASVEEAAVARWARLLGLSPQDKGYKMLTHSKFATLVGYAHPTAELQRLNPVVDFLFWIFLWDDQFDIRIDGQLVSLQTLFKRNTLAGQVLEGANLLDKLATPDTTKDKHELLAAQLLRSLTEMRNWLGQHMPAIWIERYKKSYKHYFDSLAWELELRHQGIVPDLDTYIEMRRMTSGGYWVTHLIEVAEGICLSDEVWSHPAMQELLTSTANIIGWGNDLLSLKTEMRDSGHLNLVLCLQKQYSLPMQESLEATVWMHNAEVRRFLRLRDALPSFGDEDPVVKAFIQGLCRWMRANIDWSVQSGRYEIDPSGLVTMDEWTPEVFAHPESVVAPAA
jgi:5-epi-alpha-selinene synthase